jgi:hypothetical protein
LTSLEGRDGTGDVTGRTVRKSAGSGDVTGRNAGNGVGTLDVTDSMFQRSAGLGDITERKAQNIADGAKSKEGNSTGTAVPERKLQGSTGTADVSAERCPRRLSYVEKAERPLATFQKSLHKRRSSAGAALGGSKRGGGREGGGRAH